MPIAIRTSPGSCLAIEGVKSPKTRSCYEYHPPRLSTKVRTAVGRQICAAGPVRSKNLKGKISSLPHPTEGKKKTRRIEPTGLTPVPAG